MTRLVSFAVILGLALSPVVLRSDVPRVMSYQGVLTSPNGQAVPDGNYTLTYRIYDTNTGGTPLWAEAHQVAIFGGMFSVTLGTQVALDLPFDAPYWIGVSIDGDPELLPRRRLTASPYSFSARSVDIHSISTMHLVDGAVTPDKLSTTEARPGQALVYDGSAVAWSDVGANGFVLPVDEVVANAGAAFKVTNTGSGDGVVGISQERYGVFGQSNSARHFTIGTVGYVPAPHPDSISIAVYGENDGLGFNAFAVAGLGEGAGVGVFGESNDVNGVGVWGFSGGGLAGLFSGPVIVDGDAEVLGFLYKSGGGFKIDHPVEPREKYLYHFFVESPEMTNLYDGVVELDANGEAWVQLPAWFEPLNRDFRYQLTAVGAAAPNLHVARRISGNRFQIAGGAPRMEVSWQVTGVRRDPVAAKHAMPTEMNKPPDERGYYLHPEAYGEPVEAAIPRARGRRADSRDAKTLEGRIRIEP